MRSIIGALLCVWSALAAAQAYPDNLIRDGGAAQPLTTRPLEAAVEADPGLQARRNKHAPAGKCPRPYVATWEARDNTLYLVRLDADACTKPRSVPLSLLFPGKQSPVEASWFSGPLRMEKTSAVLYVQAGKI